MHKVEPLTVDKIIKEIKPEGFISKVLTLLFPTICKKNFEDDIFRSNTIIEQLQRETLKKKHKHIHDNQI
jgi:hypothetical protein